MPSDASALPIVVGYVATREAVYGAIPQVEKDHDPDRTGAALIIDVDRLQGGTVGGAQVGLERPA